MAIQRRIFYRKLFYLTVFVVIWAFVNIATVSFLTRLENTKLETEYSLRSGILGEFSPETLSATSVNGGELLLPYRLYKPQTNKKLPVILYLHGAGERGIDNCKQLKSVPEVLTNDFYRKRHPSFIVVPQCPTGANWHSVRDAFLGISESKSQDILMQLVDEVLKNSLVDHQRVYLMGFSMGSFGAWRLAADFPKPFAAIVPISGGESVEIAASLKNLPIWTVHGDQDKSCPVDGTRKIVAAIMKNGGNPRYSELTNVGHEAWTPAIRDQRDVLDWLFDQRYISN